LTYLLAVSHAFYGVLHIMPRFLINFMLWVRILVRTFLNAPCCFICTHMFYTRAWSFVVQLYLWILRS